MNSQLNKISKQSQVVANQIQPSLSGHYSLETDTLFILINDDGDNNEVSEVFEEDDFDEDIDEDIDRESFSDKVEKVVIASEGSISFIEATIYTAEYFNIDLIDISSFITKEVKRRIEAEAIENKMLSSEFMKRNKDESLSDFF